MGSSAETKTERWKKQFIIASRLAMRMRGIAAVMVVGVTLSIAVLIDGYPKTGYDSLIHMKWFSHFVTEMFAGDPYPRWLTGMNAGFGSPVLYFYPPMAYWISAAFKWVCAEPGEWWTLGLSAMTSVVLSGVAMYAWLRARLQLTAAAVGASVYMVIPYHVGYTLYEAASISSLWAYAWMPIAMLGVERILLSKPFGAALLLIGLTLLISTNTATATVFMGLPVVYAAIAAKKARLRVVGTVIVTSFASLLICGPFLFPYLSLQQFVAYRDYYTEGFYYANNFIDKDVRHLARPLVALIFISACGWTAILCGRRDRRTLSAGWVIGSFLVVFLMLSWSECIWRAIPVWQKLQFPWRFNAVLVLSAGAISAFATEGLAQQRCRSCVAAGLISAAICLSWGVEAAKKERWTVFNNGKADQMAIALDLERAIDLPPYRPVWVDAALWRNEALADLSREFRVRSQVALIGGHPRTGMIYEVSGNDGDWIRLPQFYFPGWQVRGSHGSAIPVKPEQGTGLVLVQFEGSGVRRLTLRLEEEPSEKVGWAMAVMGLVGWCGYWIAVGKTGRPRWRLR